MRRHSLAGDGKREKGDRQIHYVTDIMSSIQGKDALDRLKSLTQGAVKEANEKMLWQTDSLILVDMQYGKFLPVMFERPLVLKKWSADLSKNGKIAL